MALVPDGRSPPPAELPGDPKTLTLEAGASLWRVHSKAYTGVQFKAIAPQTPYEGGRFDARQDGDPYLYAGGAAACAIAELWDRDLGPSSAARLIPRATLVGRALSEIRTAVDLVLIDVSYPAASQFGQTAWLTTCDSHEYEHTRTWAAWLRKKAALHAGFRWRSKRDLDLYAYVFYERQLPAGPPVFRLMSTLSVEHGPGLRKVEETMREHNAVFGP
jgi:hypothetical protein